MFGFGKRKSKEVVPVGLKDLNKKEIEIHNLLQEKVKDYLLDDEAVYQEGRLMKTSYFATNKRIITIFAASNKLRGVQVNSYYYSNMVGVKYNEGLSKKLNYDIITIDLKGTIEKLTIQLPAEVTREMYKTISEYISVNNI
ncbi:Uncharacterised protein [[Clostridium] sordellii]|uniref:Bacterial Pleckstrin homology domain-containing protein n=1 Tax=Paraclostridium sordellii TaxID=1505 RepID=A0A0C7R4A6_PARSO|nr:hypothetical protein [Paeniclostridium sordellii]CEQ04073.1 Uncharacterised protein [[Clostridium] sordellii] [Paeniclostridium sordellii]